MAVVNEILNYISNNFIHLCISKIKHTFARYFKNDFLVKAQYIS